MHSRVNQVLIEKCIAGWKEVEYEVIRDSKGNVITVCNMENLDPVGVHTGDSIVVAPSQTLGDKEYQMLRTSALNIITELGIEGGCNVQYALHPDSFEYAVIEVNPRVSRSSALASKATGFPIAKVAAKIAVGYGLDEIKNAVTGKTYACFEPALDYCVVKLPRFPFDKFIYATKTLGTQMKATGEVMSIGNNFPNALMKAVRGVEMGYDSMEMPKIKNVSDQEVLDLLKNIDEERIFVIAESFRRKISDVEKVHEITKIDRWFLNSILLLVNMENTLRDEEVTPEIYKKAKKLGFLDKVIERMSGKPIPCDRIYPVYKMVDTCAGEFASETPYYYATYDEETEVKGNTGKKKVLVLGSGPIRIGQGIEFDYCGVHAVWALKEAGYETIFVNNNPETVSTDFDTSDRLYFEPLTPEDVEGIVNAEKPDGVIVGFGGQTAIKLARHMEKIGVKILGTSASDIDAAEDREKFDKILEECDIPRPDGETVLTIEDAVIAGDKLGYPVLLRPSYVLGGQGMEIAYNKAEIAEYMAVILRNHQENPILIDKYLMGKEIEVDAICDGTDILIPGIMEHLERAGVHSGDSISVYPTISVEKRLKRVITEYTKRLAKSLNVVGLVNIQFVIYNHEVYVIEVNPRSSRTIPYISKVTGIPMVDLALKCMLGEKLADMGYGTGLYPEKEHYAVKVPVFSFQKLHNLDTQLGPEMKSTGEVLGVSKSFREALLKGLLGAGFYMKKQGGVLFSIKDTDKQEAIEIADKMSAIGFDIFATAGTASVFNRNMVATNVVRKLEEDSPNIIDLIESGKIDYVICTSKDGRDPALASVQIRRKCVERAIPCFTSLDTANAIIECLKGDIDISSCEMVDINLI